LETFLAFASSLFFFLGLAGVDERALLLALSRTRDLLNARLAFRSLRPLCLVFFSLVNL
jgi:hypothetical protein